MVLACDAWLALSLDGEVVERSLCLEWLAPLANALVIDQVDMIDVRLSVELLHLLVDEGGHPAKRA